MSDSMRKLKKTGIVFLVILLALTGIFGFYVHDYYHADQEAVDCIENNIPEGIDVSEDETHNLIFAPGDENKGETGLIFYPGGKVDERAYAPLMCRLAEDGVTCVLVKMPFHLAIMDVNAADGVKEQHPGIKTWYIGGHSLGGVAAAMYVKKHAEEFSGLILLGAYASEDLSGTELSVLSLYGENDGVMNRSKYEENKKYLPADFTEYVIPGGCHAYFGSYGEQKGDQTPSITAAKQQEITAEKIMEWIKYHSV